MSVLDMHRSQIKVRVVTYLGCEGVSVRFDRDAASFKKVRIKKKSDYLDNVGHDVSCGRIAQLVHLFGEALQYRN